MGNKEADTRVTYGLSIRNNQITLQKIHDLSSLIFGTVAGILQLESLSGFSAFLASYGVITLIVIFVIGGFTETKRFYASLWNDVIFANLGRSMSSYLMMWCLIYAMVDS